MKIAVSSKGKLPTSDMDPRFGRAEFFFIYDTESGQGKAESNTAVTSPGGAGIAAAQTLSGSGIGAVITGNIGPNAMRVLEASGISMLRGNAPTVEENIENYKKGTLKAIQTPVAPHSGMGGRSRK